MVATVSVLMPVRRLDEYVPVAIDSILAQQGITVELLIIGAPDTVNSDNSLARLLNLGYSDSRITLIARDEPGIVSALNTGLKQASGDYIARMDADDIAEPNRLRVQLDVAATQAVPGLVGACVEIFSDIGPVQAGNLRYQSWLNALRTSAAMHAACFIESPLPHPSWFAHKSVWKKIGTYTDGDFPEDYDFILRAWLAGIPMVKPGQTLLHWREHPNRLTHTDSRYRREAFINLKVSALVSPDANLSINEGRPIWIAGTGRNARYWHDALEDQQASVAGFVDIDRPNIKQSKRGKPIIRYTDLDKVRKDALIVTAVTDPIARQNLCKWFADRDMVLGRDVVLGG